MDPEPSSTPKLTFSSLPSQPREPSGMLTPPFRLPVSVPFIWEEAPGKPRACSAKPSGAKSLDLPPRLLTEIRMTTLPSPTTVLDGPYVGRSVSCTSLREIGRKNLFEIYSPEKGQFRKRKEEKFVGFWRKNRERRSKGEASLMISSSSSSSLNSSSSSPTTSNGLISRDRNASGDETKVKITRFRRNNSLLNISDRSTHFWNDYKLSSLHLASIYGSFKQVVPWRMRKLKKDGGRQNF
ncbi:uncharacterized protein At4g00950-like isoform X2 [Tasmannia lanceolata]|uniref:uncharacterized protein At4g00950-like isoform X2 n=1 Tax=Tasmannia lanceolata TaxID=3420 RepID=UPI0040634591